MLLEVHEILPSNEPPLTARVKRGELRAFAARYVAPLVRREVPRIDERENGRAVKRFGIRRDLLLNGGQPTLRDRPQLVVNEAASNNLSLVVAERPGSRILAALLPPLRLSHSQSARPLLNGSDQSSPWRAKNSGPFPDSMIWTANSLGAGWRCSVRTLTMKSRRIWSRDR